MEKSEVVRKCGVKLGRIRRSEAVKKFSDRSDQQTGLKANS